MQYEFDQRMETMDFRLSSLRARRVGSVRTTAVLYYHYTGPGPSLEECGPLCPPVYPD